MTAGVIWIVGASGALGAALAEAYARLGVSLVLQGRDEQKLAALALHCRAKGADVRVWVADLRDAEAAAYWAANEPAPDLLILCAGLNTHVGPAGEQEAWCDVDALLDVNLRSVMALVLACLPAMRTRGSGQIALVSSLAGYFGLPMTPAYSASKAAIKAYGEALRGWLAPEGLKVNVIMPGYVASPMCDAMPGPKPFLWKPEQAARVIVRELQRDRARIVFPCLLAWGGWWLAVLPAAISCRILRWLDYRA